jgi:uncharacterized alpha-E superfamily protein
VAEVGTPFDIIQWSALLKSASALEMYYKRFGRIAPDDVSAFLILDSTFPRAIRYCLIKSEDSLHAISGSEHGSYQNQAEKRLGRLRAHLDFGDVEEYVADGLHEFLDQFQKQLNGVGEAIFETFFAPRPIHSTISPGEAQ